MNEHLKCDLNNRNQQLIIAGLIGLIEDDGLSFHKAMTVLEDIKKQTFPALIEISREARNPYD